MSLSESDILWFELAKEKGRNEYFPLDAPALAVRLLKAGAR